MNFFFLTSPLCLKKPAQLIILLMVMTAYWLVYAGLEDRIRKALKEHGATSPNQKGQAVQNPTPRWVFQRSIASGAEAPGGGSESCMTSSSYAA